MTIAFRAPIISFYLLASLSCERRAQDTANDAGGDRFEGDDDGGQAMFDGANSGCTMCSSDLHEVLDCVSHTVIRACPLDTACGGGGVCVAPCAAAADNRSNVGCEYYAVTPDVTQTNGWCFAAFIANTSTQTAFVGLEYGTQSVDASRSMYTASLVSGTRVTYAPLPSGGIPPNDVAILFLASDPAQSGSTGGAVDCPAAVVPVIRSGDTAIHGTGRGKAFHITTTVPTVAYDIFPFGGGASAVSSATLLLPVGAWDTNYIAAPAFESQPSTNGFANGTIVAVAAEDRTTVALLPRNDVQGATGVDSAVAGTVHTYALDRGESLQFAQSSDLAGSIIQSDKPIGLWGGHQQMRIPTPNIEASDGAHQQIPPVRSLGSEYVAVRYRSRLQGAEESAPWRLIGAVDGTVLTYDPARPTDAPATLARGQVFEFSSASPFVIRSQNEDHPFYLAGHMTGANAILTTATDLPVGDPETVNVVPPAQYLKHYVFFTDVTYSNTTLVVIRSVNGSPVTIDCETTPLDGWIRVGADYEYTRLDLRRGSVAVGTCDNGRHEMKSDGAFGVTVWGFDTYVSYAYPAGAGFKAVNAVVVPVDIR